MIFQARFLSDIGGAAGLVLGQFWLQSIVRESADQNWKRDVHCIDTGIYWLSDHLLFQKSNLSAKTRPNLPISFHMEEDGQPVPTW